MLKIIPGACICFFLSFFPSVLPLVHALEKTFTPPSPLSPFLRAHAELRDAQGQKKGTVKLQETPNGLLTQISLLGVSPGEHAIHFHEKALCEAPSFQSAGGHFNPEKKTHGFKSKEGQHAGDLPNLSVCDSGSVQAEFFISNLSLKPGKNSLLQSPGTSFILHEKMDDHKTAPSGESGSRIACGIVQAD